MDEKYLYFYDNIDKLIGDDLLLSDTDPLVKVEDLFSTDFNIEINETDLNDNMLLLYILCIHKMSTIKHDDVIRRKLIQFFNFHKEQNALIGGGLIGGGLITYEDSNIILLKDIMQYIRDQVALIQPKHAILN
jgi:hypothetical protein